MNDTPLDRAHAAMNENDEARLRFYERLADSELFLLLKQEAENDHATPRVFAVYGDNLALAFDREDRLAEFTGEAAHYLVLSGRLLCKGLAANKLGLGLNLGVAPSSIVIPLVAIVWLDQTLSSGPGKVVAIPKELSPPAGLPENLITGLDSKLALAGGLARAAYLCTVSYDGEPQSYLLAIIDPAKGAETALANAVNEALIFSGAQEIRLDVAFFAASDPMSAKVAKVGLRFDLPERNNHDRDTPGTNPDRPPILK